MYPSSWNSLEHHGLTKALFEQHCARLTALAVAGWRVLHFVKADLGRPKAILELIASALGVGPV